MPHGQGGHLDVDLIGLAILWRIIKLKSRGLFISLFPSSHSLCFRVGSDNLLRAAIASARSLPGHGWD